MKKTHPLQWLGIIAALVFLAACPNKTPQLPRVEANDVILAFGDSLTFGTGAAETESYPAILSALIGRKVVRSGVPGEVSAQGLRRLPSALAAHNPKIVLLCLGGNDMLRKIDDRTILANLREMIQLVRRQGAEVVLLGVPKPALFGGAAKFYGELANDMGVSYEDDTISNVLRDPGLKSDLIHPNAQGYRRIAEAIAALLKKSGALL